MKHKHAEILHAIADGIPVRFKDIVYKEWVDFNKETHRPPMETDPTDYWRIKPAEVPQWRKDMAQALKDGKVVEVLVIIGHWEKKWVKTTLSESKFLDASIELIEYFYRIRPEPDVDVTFRVKYENTLARFTDTDFRPNLKLTFDANGNLKDAEVLND
jgi:hypothetical protein